MLDVPAHTRSASRPGCSSITRWPASGMTCRSVPSIVRTAGASRRGGRKVSCAPVVTSRGTARAGRSATPGAPLEREWRATSVIDSTSSSRGWWPGASMACRSRVLRAGVARTNQEAETLSSPGVRRSLPSPPGETSTSRSLRGDGQDRAMAAPKECPTTTTGPVTAAASRTSLSQVPDHDRRPPEIPRSSELRPVCPGTSGRTSRWPAATRRWPGEGMRRR